MSRILLKNAQIVKRGNILETVNVLIQDGFIQNITQDLLEAEVTYDLKGKLLMPGLVDVHVHFREPGFTDKETIASGSLAALKGGYTTVCAMPNLDPVPDTKEKYDAVQKLIEKDAKVNLLQYAPITKGLYSDEIVDMKAMNAFAYTNDGVGVQKAGVMKDAMLQAKALNKIIVAHTEDESLLNAGVMHEGIQNKELGLKGISSSVESTQIARDVILALETGVHYHVCHLSSYQSVEAIKFGRKLGAKVTSEVTPHHLLLNEMDILKDDGNYKMNPPLRSEKDQNALILGLLKGDINFIATDHAPHTNQEKQKGFAGPFGIIGLESAFGLLYTEFVLNKGVFTLENLMQWMSLKPKEIFGIEGNFMRIQDPADFAVFDLDETVLMDDTFFKSKSRNTPFIGRKIQGSCVLTMVGGVVMYENL